MAWLDWLRRAFRRKAGPRIPADVLARLQQRFHELILENRTRRELIERHHWPLPCLKTWVAKEKPERFPIPGMYGGFWFWFEGSGQDTKLIAEFSTRVVEGSGKRYEITVEGAKLVAEGFV